KFMPAERGSDRKKWIRRVNPQFAISVALGRAGDFYFEREYVGHLIARALPRQCARQEHQPATLRVHRQTFFRCPPYRLQECAIRRQRLSVSFGKTTTDIQSVQVCRQTRRLQRRDGNQFRASPLQKLKVLGIVETKC